MNKPVIDMLTSMLTHKVLDARAALEAAWKQGYKEADETYTARQIQLQAALQMQSFKAGQ